MNKAEKQARKHYEENKKLMESGVIVSARALCMLAREQDELYKIIHGRADKKNFNVKD